MLCDTNYLDAAMPAYHAVSRLLASPEGIKVAKKIAVVDLIDFLYNENGYDRYVESMPEPTVYESIIAHFSLFLTDLFDIEDMRKEVGSGLSAIRPVEIPDEHDILPTTRKAIEYLFLMIYRKLFIAGEIVAEPETK